MRVTLRRLEATGAAEGFALVFEWDEEAEWTAMAQGARTSEERDSAYERVIALQRLLRGAEVEWLDTELTERHRRVCGMTGMALVWRTEMRTEGGARALAEAVAFGLGTRL